MYMLIVLNQYGLMTLTTLTSYDECHKEMLEHAKLNEYKYLYRIKPHNSYTYVDYYFNQELEKVTEEEWKVMKLLIPQV